MNSAILATEIFGIVTLLIIMYGAWFESGERGAKRKSFMALTSTVLAALIVDAISYFPLNWTGMYSFQFTITLLAFIVPFFVYALFLQYIYVTVSEKVSSPSIMFKIGICICGIATVASFYYGIQGSLFTLIGGVYAPGVYYVGYLLSYAVVLVYTMVLIIINFKKIGIHNGLAAILFMLFPVITIVINAIIPDAVFSVASLAVSVLIVYIMLQSETEQKLMANEQASVKLAHSDELTGIQNRLAFTEAIEKMKEQAFVGVVFADLNGLKYTNDHYGHKAGDKLLCDFTDMLLSSFRKEDVYRISGDEFVVLLPGVTKDLLDNKEQYLKVKINSREFPIAAVGFVHGRGSEISRLIDMAEGRMYADKKEFHKNFPLYGRNE